MKKSRIDTVPKMMSILSQPRPMICALERRKKIIFYYIIQQYKIGPRDSTAPTESQTGSRTLHNGPQYKTGATKE